jgi:hypothetical protein
MVDPCFKDHLDLLARLDRACANRNLSEARKVSALFWELDNPNEPIDLHKIDAIARCYAAAFHGWEIDNA